MLGNKNTGDAKWWQKSVIYQVYPRSFQDGNGDGVGDLRGMINKLEYVKELGVDCLWLSPIHPSPFADFGYDIADYCDIDKLFGSMEDFKELQTKAKSLGIKIMLDGVFNHTSDEHPWFKESRSSVDNPKRDFYIWRKAKPNGSLPNNWYSVFGNPAWTLDETTNEYYLHSFDPRQPDLNWRNPAVCEEILKVLKFWLDLGVDGFRLDVFNCYFKSEDLEDNPPRYDLMGLAGRLVFPFVSYKHMNCRDQYEEMYSVLGKMRELCDKYDAALVGETLDELMEYQNAPKYVGPKKLHMDFNFKLLLSKWDARKFSVAIREWVTNLEEQQGWPTWVIDNHDMCRSATRWKRWRDSETDKRCRLVAVLLLTLRGTPYIYQGQEIGMRERRMGRTEIVDPPGKKFWPFYQGRDGCRTPMQWSAETPSAGFSSSDKPWLPLNSDFKERNVEKQQSDPDSIFSVYKKVIHLRKEHDALTIGSMEFQTFDHDKVITYTRSLENGEKLRVIVNMSSATTWFPLSFVDENLSKEEQDMELTQENVIFRVNGAEDKPHHQGKLKDCKLNGYEGLVIKL